MLNEVNLIKIPEKAASHYSLSNQFVNERSQKNRLGSQPSNDGVTSLPPIRTHSKEVSERETIP